MDYGCVADHDIEVPDVATLGINQYIHFKVFQPPSNEILIIK